MRLSNRAILSAALAACAVTAVSLPATASSSSAQGRAAERTAPPEEDQNPCQTQLVTDLAECEEEFGGIFRSNPLLEACIGGAVRANVACLTPKQPI